MEFLAARLKVAQQSIPPHTAAAGPEDLSTHMGPIAVVEFELATSIFLVAPWKSSLWNSH